MLGICNSWICVLAVRGMQQQGARSRHQQSNKRMSLDSCRRAKRVYLQQYFGQVWTHCRMSRLCWNRAAHRGMPSNNWKRNGWQGRWQWKLRLVKKLWKSQMQIKKRGKLVSQISVQAGRRAQRQTHPRGENLSKDPVRTRVHWLVVSRQSTTFLCDVPTVDLSRDRTALTGKFPEDELKAGREFACVDSQIFDNH